MSTIRAMRSVLDAVLLFALGIPVVMKYRILPVEGTPYWLFGVLFFILGAHCFVSVYPSVLGTWRKHLDSIKLLFLVLTLCISLGGATVTAMVDRAKVAPVYGVHDIILQQEAAMRYMIVGKNPYKETYFGTPVEDWHYGELGADAVNPALYHFVMPPFYLMFPFAFYYTVRPIVGFFDARMALLFSMAVLLAALYYWYRDKSLARIAMTLTALSPSVVDYFVEGRSDVFALSWLAVSLLLLHRRRYILSSISLSLAALSKQTIWFAVPFLGVYAWETIRNKRVFLSALLSGFAVSLVFVIPFLVWDARAFVDSVILYLSGNAANSYPVSGYGLGMMLYDFGIIKNIHDYYPFVMWQMGIALPVLIGLLISLRLRPSASRAVLYYAVFLTVYWYMSRYFNNSHLGYISMLFVIGGLKSVDEA